MYIKHIENSLRIYEEKSDKRKLLSISVVHEFENIAHMSQGFIYGYFGQSEHIQSNILT